MNLPLVSIGLPVYNGSKQIKNAIISLTSQSYKNFELIISDNNSTDDTEKICQEFVRIDSRVKYFRQVTNIGMLQNFNYLKKNAAGKYFMWAASDDKWHQNYLAEAVNILEENSECISVFSHFELFDTSTGDNILKITPSSNASNYPNLRLKRVLEELHPNLIYGLHRNSLLSENEFELIDWSDVLFVSKLVEKGKYYIIPKVYYWIGINGKKRIPYSITGSWLNLFRFYIKYLRLSKVCSPNTLSFLKSCFFAFKIVLVSSYKVNKDIFRHRYL